MTLRVIIDDRAMKATKKEGHHSVTFPSVA